MTVFLTGGTGYLGHSLAKRLAENGITVHALVREQSVSRLPKHNNIRAFTGDIMDQDSLSYAMEGCTAAFHLAAYTNMRCNDIQPFYTTNVTGTENILQVASQLNIEHLVYTSSLSVMGKALHGVPITEGQPRLNSFANDYELTKAMGEDLVREYNSNGMQTRILNVTRIFGPGPSTFSNGVNRLIHMLKHRSMLFVPDRLQSEANYVYIDDVVQAHINAVEYGKGGENYIIGGYNLSYDELFTLLQRWLRKTIKIVRLDYKLLRNALSVNAGLNRIFGNSQPINPSILDTLFTNRTASSEKAQNELNYTITPMEKAFLNTIQRLN